ncbi:MAG: flavodoxin-dependent (E)-4-hydroxy-3-methylbut-2-enyl-diphosphate synthase [Clostridia bacterium]|nr:flavodoxin-dependent (E)-4-hydroxy-3-methylbut-2-enyl-diphosphate synthase [Clostridia bacterium]
MAGYTKKVKIGNITIGGGNPVAIQSMLNIPANDIKGNVAQAVALEKAGCEIIRTAVPNLEAVKLVDALKQAVNIPVVADIHFDYKIALECVAAGVDKIRINPGNIGDNDRVKAVANACKANNVPIRVGVNSGSVEKNILKKYGGVTADALVESALYHTDLLNKFDFDDIVISMKASDVKLMFDAYKIAADKVNYPLHLGVTEAGTQKMGTIKSAAGIGGLLLSGIGDTIRVSLTDDPVYEIKAAKDILSAVGLRRFGVNVVSCPTCGRTKIDLIGLAKRVEDALSDCDKQITVAVMGCVVNGPGEAKEADIGIAGGDNCGIIFKKGEILRKVDESQLFDELMNEIKGM